MKLAGDILKRIKSWFCAHRKELVTKRNMGVLALLLVMVLSVTTFSSAASSVETYGATINTLNEQQKNITALLASATSASAVISAIPDDTGTPIANSLADLSKCFLVALSVVYAEKYSLTIIGHIVFTWAVPIALGLLIWCCCRPGRKWQWKLAWRILAFSMVLFFVTPVSGWICDNIEQTYSYSMQDTINMVTQVEEITETETEENKSFWDTLTDAANSVFSGVADAFEWAKTILNRMVEAVAVVLVTSCVIPLLVLVCMIVAVKMLLGIDIDVPNFARLRSNNTVEQEQKMLK